MPRDEGIAAGAQLEEDLRAAMPDDTARRALDRALNPWRGWSLYVPLRTPQADAGIRVAARYLVDARAPGAIDILRRRFGISERTARRRLREARDEFQSVALDL